MREYIVKKDDTLWGIAKQELHSASRYTEIVQTNHLISAALQPGQKLRLPQGECRR